ncbi:Transcriptional regulator [Brevinematales bacterium NS]|nr:LacI family DNA-binding transcriptional regulator [Brevinematales bacterium]QJR23170.1 Transcriptional regulator [Brevinematales bacterium NS]
MSTIRDIAREAGVSIATVSRVLKGGTNVKPETYQKIIEVIEKRGYRPNRIAQKLVKKQTTSRTIGILIPDITQTFFIEIIRGIYDVLRAEEYNLFVFNIPNLSQSSIFPHILEENLAGLLVINFRISREEAHLLRHHHLPFLVVENHLPYVHSIYVNNRKGGELAAQYLLSHSLNKIALIGENRHTLQQQERFEGFKNYIQKHHLSISLIEEYISVDSHLPYSHYTQEAYELTLRLATKEGVDGFFFYCDELAYGGISARQEIEKKIFIVGYDDLPPSAYLGLTTIRQPAHEMGKLGASHLLKLLHKKSEEDLLHLRLDPQLIIRN